MKITPIPAFNDNYIWSLERDNQAILVDPGCGSSALAYLQNKQLTLSAVLITHHHNDHVGGLTTLLAHFPDAQVYGPAHLDNVSNGVEDGAAFSCGFIERVTPIYTPGHTLDHICYQIDHHLFCGDTLFSAGCGRMFEGDQTQFYHSLHQLSQLPKETLIYCAHEYTLSNLAFAKAVEPDNQAIQIHVQKVKQLRSANMPSLPSVLATELDINPFLRTQSAKILEQVPAQYINKTDSPAERFAALRRWKDNY